MKKGATAGFEVNQHREELIPIIKKIMQEHTARNGCEWEPGSEELILCDLATLFEKYEHCKIAA
jgi:hypothetical protein